MSRPVVAYIGGRVGRAHPAGAELLTDSAMMTSRDQPAEPGGPDTRYTGLPLQHPVEVLIDRWGIPHLYADSVDDVFVAQGFNVARDRLFQIDLWRRRGRGQLAEVFGPAYVAQDRANRLLSYRGEMEAEWRSYGPQARRFTECFVAGVNAYVDWVSDHPADLPPEFGRMDYHPARWSAEDVVRIRTHGIAFNVRSEVNRARTVARASVRDDLVRRRLEPEHLPPVPEGIDPALPDEVLAVYDLATQGVSFTDDSDHPITADAAAHELGSNNWVVAGSRTATGRPLLAADPHRPFTTPSLRYLVHLCAPELDVIGAGEPSVPGIAVGHNGHVAFGFTIFPIDTEDLYTYELDPQDHGRYRYGDGVETLRVEHEQIAVRGEEPRTVTLSFTRHGPVLYVDEARHRAYALRTTWTEPGTAAYLGSLDYLRARTADEFRAITPRCQSPGENHVYADVHGVIGWKPAGLVPRRVGYDGLLPVPGDGHYGWDGFYSAEELPGVHEPVCGYWATANEYNLPADYPTDRQLSYEWPDPARYQRIAEVLAENDAVSVSDAMALQNDVVSVAAREVIQVLDGLESNEPTERAALALLTEWDAAETVDSAAAALYEVWMTRHLRPAFTREMVSSAAYQVIGNADLVVVRQALREPAQWFGPTPEATPEATRDALMRRTLRSAYAEVEGLLGDDPRAWRWGDLHSNLQPHVLGGLDPTLDVGPFAAGGSGTTVAAGTYRPADFRQTSGASVRLIVDVGSWDNSVVINTPGQAGDPRSQHYRDLATTWQAGTYVPLRYSRASVEQELGARLWLLPHTGASSDIR